MAHEFAKKLYASKAWIELRQCLIIERGPVCQKCGRIMADTSKLIGHHTIALTANNVNDPSVALNKELIKLYCLDCHNKLPGHFNSGNHREVYLVYGAPCSGKMSLVNQMAERGDIIYDIDRVFECISGRPLYDKPDNLRFNAFAIRDKMLDMLKTRYGQWYSAFVVGTYPNKAERERVATDLGAELLYCNATREQCYATMQQRQLPTSYAEYIDRWFEDFTS
jgi:hypothetical protein